MAHDQWLKFRLVSVPQVGGPRNLLQGEFGLRVHGMRGGSSGEKHLPSATGGPPESSVCIGGV